MVPRWIGTVEGFAEMTPLHKTGRKCPEVTDTILYTGLFLWSSQGSRCPNDHWRSVMESSSYVLCPWCENS